ncbi:MAG: exodeoxyribonuclease VII large subunit [Muribaculaceae bacterium]|nr:exodeoxyribonuclease VII large subunit [Muribaculaceae bacterium]
MNSTPRTLLQFTTAIGNAIRRTPELYSAWVIAELSDVRISGGHCYMELVEKNEEGSTVAKIRGMIWSSLLHRLRSKFCNATGKDISTGLKVMIQVTATHHPVYGLSLTINDIDPSYTMGDLERLRREILERLQREGVIDRNKRIPLPLNPQRIAVVSAAGAAGYGDFSNQLESNSQGFVFYPHLFPAIMQGEKTPPTVLAALDNIEMTVDLWDCVVIIRGGGSTTDMNAFDNYELAHRVATFPLPVIVGIGHERDRCVLDEIAHTRCKTPTAVAGFLIDSLSEAWIRADRLTRAIAQYATENIKGETHRLTQTGSAIPVIAANILERNSVNLNFISEKLQSELTRLLDKERDRLENLEKLTNVLSPANTLKRGFSITRLNGHAITDISGLKEGDKIETTLLNGTVQSVISNKKCN